MESNNEQATIAEPVRERQLCRICRKYGHDMWIYIKHVTMKDGREFQLPINFYSNTKHWHLGYYTAREKLVLKQA
jgi:hypothetical protein